VFPFFLAIEKPQAPLSDYQTPVRDIAINDSLKKRSFLVFLSKIQIGRKNYVSKNNPKLIIYLPELKALFRSAQQNTNDTS
jgi:hypothetical protein